MIDEIIALAKKKCKYHEEQKHTDRTTHEHYLSGIYEELDESKKEIKHDNHVYLEDELGDVLRDYINILVTLENQGYICSVEDVVSRSYKKYKERVDDKLIGIQREETKKRQKIVLEKEHLSTQ